MAYGKQRNETEWNRTEQNGMASVRTVSGKNDKCIASLQYSKCLQFEQRLYL